MWVKHRSFDLIKELLGHRDVRTTQHYYRRWCKAREAGSVDMLYPQTSRVIEMPKQTKRAGRITDPPPPMESLTTKASEVDRGFFISLFSQGVQIGAARALGD